MLGINAKRGIEATFERVYAATGNYFKKVNVRWDGATAGIRPESDGSVSLIFPPIGDTAEISRVKFNDFIGYALHELGHAWFTTAWAWDAARREHGDYVSGLINGLEDPRIEACVIASGYAGNSATLFESLVNNILAKSEGAEGGYVHPNDVRNIPFQLAIEGRRLNGYRISKPPVLQDSIYCLPISEALKAAKKAKSTAAIVKIALRLNEQIKQIQDEQKPEEPKDKPEDKPEDGGDDGEAGDKGKDGEAGDEAGDEGKAGDQAGDQTGDQAGDQAGDEAGDKGKGKAGDEAGDEAGDQTGGEAGDEAGDVAGVSSGYGEYGEVREVEPRSFIDSAFKQDLDLTRRPVLNVVRNHKITWS